MTALDTELDARINAVREQRSTATPAEPIYDRITRIRTARMAKSLVEGNPQAAAKIAAGESLTRSQARAAGIHGLGTVAQRDKFAAEVRRHVRPATGFPNAIDMSGLPALVAMQKAGKIPTDHGPIGNAMVRGHRMAAQSRLFVRSLAPGASLADSADDIVAARKALKAVPVDPASEAFNQAESFSEAIKAFVNDPVGIGLPIMAESAVTFVEGQLPAAVTTGLVGAGVGSAVPGAGTAAGALTGSIVGAGAGSLLLEASGEYFDFVENHIANGGGDVDDPAAWRKALADPAIASEARSFALRKGIPIAVLDALSVGVAGRLSAPIKGPIKKMLATGGEVGIQMVAGAGGETLGQLAQQGTITSPGGILAEAVGEVGGGTAEVVGMRSIRGAARPISVSKSPAAGETAPLTSSPTKATPAQTIPTASARRPSEPHAPDGARGQSSLQVQPQAQGDISNVQEAPVPEAPAEVRVESPEVAQVEGAGRSAQPPQPQERPSGVSESRMLNAQLQPLSIDALDWIRRNNNDSHTRQRAKAILKSRGVPITTPGKLEPFERSETSKRRESRREGIRESGAQSLRDARRYPGMSDEQIGDYEDRAIRTIGDHLQSKGARKVGESPKSESVYFVTPNGVRVRVSAHDLPDTPERDFAREHGPEEIHVVVRRLMDDAALRRMVDEAVGENEASSDAGHRAINPESSEDASGRTLGPSPANLGADAPHLAAKSGQSAALDLPSDRSRDQGTPPSSDVKPAPEDGGDSARDTFVRTGGGDPATTRTVPPEVLADYPDLTAPAQPGAAAETPAKPRGGRRGTAGFPAIETESVVDAHGTTHHVDPVAPWNKGKDVSAPDVIEAIADVLDKAIPIRGGRGVGRGHMGHYEFRPDVIRLRTANDITTATHELGHAIEDAVFGMVKGSPWKKPTVSPSQQRELTKLGRALYGSRKPKGGYKREGFSEFIRLYLTSVDGSKAKVEAPEFWTYFHDTFLKDNPSYAKPLEAARAKALQWYGQGTERRALASIAPDTPGISLPSRTDLKGTFVDQFAILEKFAAEAEAKLGRTLTTAENPYLAASALRMTHASVLNNMVEEGMQDFPGNPTGESLSDVMAIVRGRRKEFTIYMWARRALRLWDSGRNPGLSKQDATAIFNKLHNPRFELAASKFYRWWDGVLDYAAESSPTFAKAIESLRKGDVGDYLPLMREFDEMTKLFAARSQGGTLGKDPAKRLAGSGRRVLDMFHSTIKKADQWIRAAHHQYVLEQIFKLANSGAGMGKWLVEVPKDKVPVRVDAEQAIKALVKRGALTGDIETSTDAAEMMVTFFTPAQRPLGKGDVPVVPILRDGKIVWFEIDPKLYASLAGLDTVQVHQVIDWLFVKPAAMFRTGTTGINAAFSLYTNPARDLPTFLLQTTSKTKNPLRLLQAWALGMKDSAASALFGRHTQWSDIYLRLGGHMVQPLGQDIHTTRRTVRRLFQGKFKRIIDVRNGFDLLRGVLQLTDAGPRIGELRQIAHEAGFDPRKDKLTNEISMEMRLGMKRVTVDFTAGGSLTKFWNRITPYHGAQIQGLRSFARSFHNRPMRSVLYGLSMITGLTMLLWLRNRDEEWYKDMPANEKHRYWYIPLGENLLRIPRPFDWSLVFGVLPESIIESLYQQDAETAIEAARFMAGSLVPPLVPQVPKIIGEQLANVNAFTGKPIVSRGDEFLPPGEQAGPNTTWLAKQIGEALNLSPKRIDHLVMSTGGGLARDVTRLMSPDSATRAIDDLSTIPVASAALRPGGVEGIGSEAVDEMYRLLDELEKRVASKADPATRSERGAKKILTGAARIMSPLRERQRTAETLEERQKIQRRMRELANKAIERAKSRMNQHTGQMVGSTSPES